MLISEKYSFVAGRGEDQTAGYTGLRGREVFFKPTANGEKIGWQKWRWKSKCGEGAVRLTQITLLFVIPDDFHQFYPNQARDGLMEIATILTSLALSSCFGDILQSI